MTGHRSSWIVRCGWSFFYQINRGSIDDAGISAYHKDLAELQDQQSALSQAVINIEQQLKSFVDRSLSSSSSSQKDGHDAAGVERIIQTSSKSAATKTGYTFWSSDFHISPIADVKDLFGPIGMNVIDKSLSGHCHLKNTCARDLKVSLV